MTSTTDELITTGRELANELEREGDSIDEASVLAIRTLANVVEAYRKSNAQLIKACNRILAGPENGADETLQWAKGVIRDATEKPLTAAEK